MSKIGALSKVAKFLDEVLASSRRAEEAEPRVKQILQDMPYTADIYTPESVASAVDSSAQLRGISPSEFLELAYPIEMHSGVRDLRDHYIDLIREGRWVEPPQGIFTERYLSNQRARPFRGFDDVPFLEVQEKPGMEWQIGGHEGRHRSLALEKLYGPDEPQLTRFLKQYDSEKPLGLKFPQKTYTEARDGNWLDLTRTRRYKRGGLSQLT